MRIIAGKFKGRKIDRVNTPLTREAQDKVRGAIFNSLYTDIVDARVLDLFGGSGSYGFEALSRGARNIVMIDQQVKAIETMKTNIENLGIKREEARIIQDDFRNAMDRLIKAEEVFDIVFIDAPYKLVLDSVDFKRLDLLTHSDSILVYEMGKEIELGSDEVLPFVVDREKQYGIKKVVYYYKL